MLAIRMQRTGRKGHANFRVVVQDSRQTPTSGKFVASLGSYDPHTKKTTLSTEKAQFYIDNGAQPSGRVAELLKSEGVKLPSWVVTADKKTSTVRHPEKLRKNRPVEEAAPAEEPAEAATAEAETTEAPEADAPVAEATPTEEA